VSPVRVGLIRVISSPDPGVRDEHGRWMMERFPSLHVVSRGIEGFPDGLFDRTTADSAVPAVVDVAQQLASDVDVLLVSCTEDPGVTEVRRGVSVPVVGAGAALVAICRSLSDHFGILTISAHPPRPLRDGLNEHRVSWRRVPNVRFTTDLPAARENIVRSTEELVDEGCGVIVLGCTGFSTLRISTTLREQFGVPVLDPVLSMGAVISALYGSPRTTKEVV